jgi:hypothetical protein
MNLAGHFLFTSLGRRRKGREVTRLKEKDEKVKAWVFIFPVVLAVLPLILKFTVMSERAEWGGVAILMMAGLGVGTLINKLITKLTSKGGDKIEKIEKEEQKEV